MISSKIARLRAVQEPEEGGHLPTVQSDEVNWDLIDTPRMRASTRVPTKMQACLSGKWSMHSDSRAIEPNNDTAIKATSEESLNRILDSGKDIEKANDKCLHRLAVPRRRLAPLVMELSKMYPNCSISMSGFFLYPEAGGYMGWHTNSDAPYTRLYITHVIEPGKSFFRYRNDGECVTSLDSSEWTMREFDVTDKPEDRLWHCVYSDTKRLSVGFRIIRNLK